MQKDEVALVGCESYERELVESRVGRAFDLLGGAEAVVPGGGSVFVKVNGLLPADPAKSITTHPEVLRAVVLQLKQVTNDIVIGDSPGGPFNQALLRRIYDKCGFAAVAEETGVALNFDIAATQVTVSAGAKLKSVTICEAMTRADHLVSVSKFKTHMFVNISGAIKNVFGAVPGMTKFSYHSRFSQDSDFADLLVDVMLASGAGFHLVDAVTGMEGNGPRVGDIKQMGIIAAGADACAVDTAMMSLIGIDSRKNKALAAAAARGLTDARVESLSLLGDDPAALAVDGFQLPNKKDIGEKVPGFVMERFGKWMAMRPVPQAGVCTGCRKCVDICPAHAIEVQGKLAVVDADKCIRCYCCHELCEFDAIGLERPLLLRMFNRIGG